MAAMNKLMASIAAGNIKGLGGPMGSDSKKPMNKSAKKKSGLFGSK